MRGTPEEIAALKVGDTLYNFDGNRRSYQPGLGGAPIYERHFEPVKIVGETKQSWIMDRYQTKVSKKTLDSPCHYADRGYFTKTGMDDDIWLHDHRHKIVRELQRAGTAHLKEVARIIGYQPS
jgi:hypothetical protein